MTQKRQLNILVVDDDEINLAILVKGVQDAGHKPIPFKNSQAAWEHLVFHPKTVDIALLDKMMPGINGIQLLKRIKESEELRHIPVIMQTGDAGVQQMQEGLKEGAYYYLTKPFHPEILNAIINSASNECTLRQDLVDQLQQRFSVLHLLHDGIFAFRTPEQARTLAAGVSLLSKEPEKIAMGIIELLLNAIEHGNLDIGTQRKRECLLNGTYDKEIAARLENPAYRNRVGQMEVERRAEEIHITITDEGKGFDWQHYVTTDEALFNLNEPNGRGISRAKISALKELSYSKDGRQVHCLIRDLAMPSMMKGADIIPLRIRHSM